MNADLTKKHEKISQVRDINGLSFGIYKPLSTGISRSIGPCYIQITVKFVSSPFCVIYLAQKLSK